MTAKWQPYREPIRTAVLRNAAIAIVIGTVISALSGGRTPWAIASLIALWPSFGGHWVEVGFLNWLRPRLPRVHAVQVACRLGIWFVAGAGFATAMRLSLAVFSPFRAVHLPPWWIAGLAFIGIELIAHLGLQLRGKPNFYNGLG